MKRTFLLSMLIIMSFFSMNVLSQEKKTIADSVDFYLKHVVVTANRYEKNAFETSIPVNSIQQRKIWQSGLDNVGEILKENAGINYSDAGPWSQKLVVRGLAGPQVLTLVDGMRLDVLRSYGNHAPLIDVNQIERIEVIRGPASTLYGSEAIAGVVNYITIQPTSISNGFALKGNAGIQYSTVNNQRNENINLSSQYRNWNFMFGFTNRQADNVNTPMGELNNTSFSGYTLNGKIKAQYFDKHFITFSGQSNRMNDVGVPTNPYAIRAKFLKYNRDVASMTYEYRAPGSFLTNARINAYYQQGERNFEAFIYQKPNGPLFVNQLLNANRQVKSYGSNFQNSFSISDNNLLTAGIDVFAEFDDTRRIADPAIYNSLGEIMKDPPADLTPPTPKSNRKSLGVFIEDEHNAGARLTLTIGGRFDYTVSQAEGTPGTLAELDMEKTDSDFSGNFGVLYRFKNNVHFTANVGRAFKAPTLQERFFSGNAQVGYLTGNPQLDSENSLNLDSGFKWQSEKFSGGFSIFQNRINNFIVMKPISAAADTFIYDNVGKAVLFGGEINAKYKFFRHFNAFANSSYVVGDDENTTTPLPKIPPFQGMLGLRYEGTNNLFWIEINGRFVSSQDRVAKNEATTSGYNLFNFRSGINLRPILKLDFPLHFTLNIRNIFDESYRDHLSNVTWWDAPGRNIIFGLNSNF